MGLPALAPFSPVGEEGLPNMPMGSWWGKFHRNSMGSRKWAREGAVKPGKSQGPDPGSRIPGKVGLTKCLPNDRLWGPNLPPCKACISFTVHTMLCCLKSHHLEQRLGRGWRKRWEKGFHQAVGRRKTAPNNSSVYLSGTGFTEHFLL